MMLSHTSSSKPRVFPSLETRQQVIRKECFALHSLIGEGGFGKVVSGYLIKTKEWYAIKCISKTEILKHKTGMTMIFNELRALERVSHPLVVSLKFAFQDKKICFLVLDLKCGGDLRHYLKVKQTFHEGDVAFYVACLSSALQHIHSRNVIHRDVKPENIILDGRGYPHLTDFGVAHVQNDYKVDKTLTSRLASGTKQYLAPEIFCKAHVHGPECDYWALGVVAFELLFSRRPFEKHCPIAYINYLENAFAYATKARQKFQAKQMLSSSSSSSPSATTLSTSYPSAVNASSLKLSINSESSEFDSERSPSLVRPKPSSSLTAQSPLNANTSNEIGTNSQTQFSPKRFESFSPSSAFRKPVLNIVEDDEVKDESQPHAQTQDRSCGDPDRGIGYQTSRRQHTKQRSSGVRSHIVEGADETSSEEYEHGTSPSIDEHWLVDEGELPPSLRISIPTNIDLSSSCVSLLEGLFEIRPCYRLGARNFESLRRHAWFEEFGLDDWSDIDNKKIVANFKPGNDYFNEISNSHESLIDQYTHGEESNFFNSSPCTLTGEQQALFADYSFVDPAYNHLFTSSLQQLSHVIPNTNASPDTYRSSSVFSDGNNNSSSKCYAPGPDNQKLSAEKKSSSAAGGGGGMCSNFLGFRASKPNSVSAASTNLSGYPVSSQGIHVGAGGGRISSSAQSSRKKVGVVARVEKPKTGIKKGRSLFQLPKFL